MACNYGLLSMNCGVQRPVPWATWLSRYPALRVVGGLVYVPSEPLFESAPFFEEGGRATSFCSIAEGTSEVDCGVQVIVPFLASVSCGVVRRKPGGVQVGCLALQL